MLLLKKHVVLVFDVVFGADIFSATNVSVPRGLVTFSRHSYSGYPQLDVPLTKLFTSSEGTIEDCGKYMLQVFSSWICLCLMFYYFVS